MFKAKFNNYLNLAGEPINSVKEKVNEEIQKNNNSKNEGIDSKSISCLPGEKKYNPSDSFSSEGIIAVFVSKQGIRCLNFSASGYKNQISIDFGKVIFTSYDIDFVSNAVIPKNIVTFNFLCEDSSICIGIEVYRKNNFEQLIELVISNCSVSSNVKNLNEKILEKNYLYAVELARNYLYLDAINILKQIPETSSIYKNAVSKIKLYNLEREKRTCNFNGRRVEVTNIITFSNISVPNFDTIYGNIVAVKLLLTNTSKREGNFQFSDFTLIDSNGCIYNELTDFIYTSWRQQQGYSLRANNYYPGEIREDIVCFRVSPTANNFTFIWNGQKVKLWI
jgi:hypothetical protein